MIVPPLRGLSLVLAPPPDDETFNCGGVAALDAKAGDPVHVVVLSFRRNWNFSSRALGGRKIQ